MLNLYDILREVLNEAITPQEVTDAINNKVRVLIQYDDEKTHHTGMRIIEPYVYGTSRAGNDVLRAYQYNGDTARGVPKWKLFRLDRVTSWEPTEQHFNIDPKRNGWNAEDYNENGDGSMVNVLAQVQFDRSGESFSPNDTLNKIRRQRQNAQQSQPINVFKQGDNGNGPVIDDNMRDMIRRNMEITNKEKEQNGFNIKQIPRNSRGPIIPQDGESIEDARRRRKRERDRDYYYNVRKPRRQMAMADRGPIRSKGNEDNEEEIPLNDIER